MNVEDFLPGSTGDDLVVGLLQEWEAVFRLKEDPEFPARLIEFVNRVDALSGFEKSQALGILMGMFHALYSLLGEMGVELPQD